ncbi:MAG: type 2 periplasmic-binding domain-containing protein [Planctomycetota bacterium]
MKRLMWVLMFAAACTTASAEGDAYVFRAALFPWIPDAAGDGFAAMRQRIEAEFEAIYADIDLDLRFFFGDEGYYQLDSLQKWLTNDPANAAGGYHVVEVDAVLLGLLVNMNLVQPWDSLPRRDDDWIPLGLDAIQVNGQRYGVPHWLCGYYIISRDSAVLEAETIEELAQALDAAPQALDLAGRLAGGWELPTLYLDAWSDTHGPDSIQSAVSTALDSASVHALKTVAEHCDDAGTSLCLDGELFDDFPDSAAIYFADGVADATWGYSERLNIILNRAVGDTSVGLASAPFGAGNFPLGFTDAYVKRPDCDSMCQFAAYAFAQYMTEPGTFEWMVMAEDAGSTAVPRYLIPGTASAFETDSLIANRYYIQIFAATYFAAPMPNVGIPAVHDSMQTELDRLLTRQRRRD